MTCNTETASANASPQILRLCLLVAIRAVTKQLGEKHNWGNFETAMCSLLKLSKKTCVIPMLNEVQNGAVHITLPLLPLSRMVIVTPADPLLGLQRKYISNSRLADVG